eukprot:TRINITY_DN8202_c0_g1_i1.p1 TRINITY_DN8202_c0_g1~~TRINITY_DN8202_c0_g1_i1.p1  ORF type:complete len:151 (-),score=11.22 TRINITY_DN8202_c0_g1_i1:28-480(-)
MNKMKSATLLPSNCTRATIATRWRTCQYKQTRGVKKLEKPKVHFINVNFTLRQTTHHESIATDPEARSELELRDNSTHHSEASTNNWDYFQATSPLQFNYISTQFFDVHAAENWATYSDHTPATPSISQPRNQCHVCYPCSVFKTAPSTA